MPLQQRFAAVAARYERLCGQQREALRQTEHLFQTLLHRAFRGEPGQGNVAPDSDIEAEGALVRVGMWRDVTWNR